MGSKVWFCSVLFGASLLGGQANSPDACPQARIDPYSTIFVRSAFESFRDSQKQGIIIGSQIKQFTYNFPSLPQLGDAVSIAVLKLYALEELVRPENTEAYLTLVSLSFSDGQRVLDGTDQRPRITSLVLDYLEEKEISEPRIEKRIAYLKGCVKDFSCSSQGEYAFFKSH